jgi:hypothetical protein
VPSWQDVLEGDCKYMSVRDKHEIKEVTHGVAVLAFEAEVVVFLAAGMVYQYGVDRRTTQESKKNRIGRE